VLDRAEIVIIGGGIIGCSIAYHLTRMGKTDVLLLEKSGLTHGATWHAAGLVGQLRSSRNLTRMLQRSVALYDRLEAETGQATDWRKVGSLRLASSPDRLLEIKRAATMAKSFGLEMSIVSAKEAQDLCPILNVEDVLAAAYLPSDGYVDPASVTQALAKGARMKGARMRQGIRVTGFERKGQRVTQLQTDQGAIECDIVVNAAGMWARELGLMMGVRVPSIAVEHQYLITDPILDLPKAMPTFRDPDLRVYYKPEVRGIVIGGWEEGTPTFGEAGIPPEFGQQLLEGNFDRFQVLAEAAFKRTPIVEKVGVRQLINGPIPFSADGEFVMGKAPELDNAFVCAGFTYGIAGGGGAGEMMAEWIVSGKPSLNLWPLDIRRFSFHHAAKQFIYPRAVDLYGKYYAVGYPRVEHQSARGIRRSPLYETLGKLGAIYGSRGGWERPNWFAPPGTDTSDRPSFDRPNWFEHVGAEHRAVRERVALIDQTSFSKFELSGPGAAAALQRLAAADIDKPAGSVIYTQLCNERGGIECDLTLSRLDANHFYIVTGSAFGTHDLHWIHSHLPPDGSAIIRDVTSARAVINLCGPLARKVLELVAEEDVSNAVLPFAHCKQITLGARGWRADRLCRRTRVGLHPDRVCCPRLRAPPGGGPDIRDNQCRLSGHRHAAHGEGLRLLEQRHHARLHAVRSRTRLPRLAEEERFRRTGCARQGQGRRPEAAPVHVRSGTLHGCRRRRVHSAQWHGAGRDHQRQLRPYDQQADCLRIHSRRRDGAPRLHDRSVRRADRRHPP
jgi:4-methylaminobutanoate oxidase (formaldehyde-forming)